MTTTLEVRAVGDNLRVTSPFRPAFTQDAKRIGGKWDGDAKQWVFPLRFDAEVRDLVRRHFGSTGDEPTATIELGPLSEGVTLDVLGYGDLGYYRHGFKLKIAGRDIAWATGRDGGARLGDGVIVVKGGFTSGGSRKNYCCDMRAETVLRVLDIPRSVADRLAEEYGGEVVRVIDAEGEARKAALREERAKLAARLAEIDAELGGE